MESPGLLILRIHIDLHVHQGITILADMSTLLISYTFRNSVRHG